MFVVFSAFEVFEGVTSGSSQSADSSKSFFVASFLCSFVGADDFSDFSASLFFFFFLSFFLLLVVVWTWLPESRIDLTSRSSSSGRSALTFFIFLLFFLSSEVFGP